MAKLPVTTMFVRRFAGVVGLEDGRVGLLVAKVTGTCNTNGAAYAGG
jgi:hypothetical protein